MITAATQEIIKKALAPYNPQFIGVFGSYARDQQNSGSDMDILVRFGTRITLFELVGLEQDISAELGIKVDLVTVNALNPLIRKQVEADIVQIPV